VVIKATSSNGTQPGPQQRGPVSHLSGEGGVLIGLVTAAAVVVRKRTGAGWSVAEALKMAGGREEGQAAEGGALMLLCGGAGDAGR